MIDLIGVPFAYGGRGPDAYDCYGLVRELYRRRSGVVLPDYASPTKQVEIASMMDLERRLWRRCDDHEGAIILIRIRGFGSHVGMVCGLDRFIHAWEGSKQVVIERVSHWQHRIEGFYEYVGDHQL